MRALVLILISIFQTYTTPCAIARTLQSHFIHKNNKVRIVFPRELEPNAENLVKWSLDSLIMAENRSGLKLNENVEIYFDPHASDHNGLATVLPRNRIFIHTASPEINSSIGIYRHYLLETLTHEWGHILSLQQNEKIFSTLSLIVGKTSRPNGLWPRWIHEGIAIWTEEALGGRPQSGSIDLDLRMYAEYAQRKSKKPIQNSDLDGQWPVQRFSSGQVPYTFGYLIINHASKKDPTFVKKFSILSSQQLGISFRKIFSHLGHNLDEIFEDLSNEWKQTKLSSKKNINKKISTAEEISGLSTYNNTVSWIELDEQSHPQITYIKDATISRFSLRSQLLRPLKAYSLDKNFWAIYLSTSPQWLNNSFYKSPHVLRRRLIIYDKENGIPVCVFNLGEQSKNIELNANRIFWTEVLRSGEENIWSSEWDLDCNLHNKNLLFKPQKAFQRISEISSLSQDKFTFGLNPLNKDSIEEKIFNSTGEIFKKKQSQKNATFSKLRLNKSENEGLIFKKDKSYWGPLYVRKNSSNEYEAYPLEIQTGANEAIDTEDGIYVIEKFWDKDELILHPKPSPNATSTQKFVWQKEDSANDPSDEKLKDSQVERHSPLNTIWPHFWVPSLQSAEGTWLISGTTFYSDITQTWLGASSISYNTQIRRPLLFTSLSYSPQERQFWPHITTQFNYNPRDVSYFLIPDQTVQERWSLDLATQFYFSLEQRWLGNISLGLSHRYSGLLGDFEKTHHQTPFLAWSLSSPNAFNPYTSTQTLSDKKSFLRIEQRTRFLESLEIQMESLFLWNTSNRSALFFVFEGAHTEKENFPLSYFIWGGAPLFNTTLNENFLNRGFAPQSFAARQIARLSTEFAYTLWEPALASSWNRLRLQTIEVRLIGESLTWTSIFGSKYQLGRQYSSSLGTEWDFVGSSLHYLKYKMSLGVFRGFGENADTRFTAQLKVGLDI